MKELISAARIGRSLGVHLILTTQKPTGVVDEQIWSNSKFKISLKVSDESDSKEILKTIDAAYITNPGRAYLKVGNDELYELFQYGYSAKKYEIDNKKYFDQRIYELKTNGNKIQISDELVEDITENEINELQITLKEINNVYHQMNFQKGTKPWLEPLKKNIIAD